MTIQTPNAADLGRFFTTAPNAYAVSTPAKAMEHLLSDDSGAPMLRNSAAFHFGIGILVEALLERIVIPYQTTASLPSLSGLATDLKPGAGGSGTGLENLLGAGLPESLRLVSKRNQLSDEIRFTPADHWLALQEAVKAILDSTTDRVKAVTAGAETLTLLAPSLASDDPSGYDYDTWSEPAEYGSADFLLHWGVRLFEIEKRASGYEIVPDLADISLDGRDVNLTGGGDVELYHPSWSEPVENNSGMNIPSLQHYLHFYCRPRPMGGLIRPAQPARYAVQQLSTLRASYVAIDLALVSLAHFRSTTALVPVSFSFPHTTTSRTVVYQVNADGSMTVRSDNTTTTTSTLSSIQCERGVSSDGVSGAWNIDENRNVSWSVPVSEIPLSDHYKDASGVPEDPDDQAEYASLQQALSDAQSDAAAAAEALSQAQYLFEALHAQTFAEVKRSSLAQTDLNFGIYRSATGMHVWDDLYITFLFNGENTYTGSFDPWGRRLNYNEVAAEIPDWLTKANTILQLQSNFSEARTAKELADAALSAAQAAVDNFDWPNSDATESADIYTGIEEAWTRTWLDGQPSPYERQAAAGLTTHVEVALTSYVTIPSSNPTGTATRLWPAASVLSAGYVGAMEMAVGEWYHDEVQLFFVQTFEGGGKGYRRHRQSGETATERVRVHMEYGSGTPTSDTATDLATATAVKDVSGLQQIFDFGEFSQPIQIIEPEGTAAVVPQGIDEEGATPPYGFDGTFTFHYNPHKSAVDPVSGKLIPYKITKDTREVWAHGSADLSYTYVWHDYARSQSASVTTCEPESFTLEHSQKAALHVDWSFKAMPVAD